MFDDDIIFSLNEIKEECKLPNWDGYGARPVLESTVDYARRLIKSMPSGITTPSLSADPDGCITFEWYKSSDMNVNLSINSSGIIHYIGIMGNNKHYGNLTFVGFMPQIIISLIVKLF